MYPAPAPQFRHIDRKKRKGKIVEDYNKDRAALANKKVSALFLKPDSPTPSNTGSARSFQRDTEKGTKVMRYREVAYNYTDVRPGYRVLPALALMVQVAHHYEGASGYT